LEPVFFDIWQFEKLVLIVGVFIVAGFVKGVLGLGLPTISLGLLTVFFGLKGAMVLMIVPSFTTNLWQGIVGGRLAHLLKRFWLLFGLAVAAIWVSARYLRVIDADYLAALLGLVTFLYGAIGLLTLKTLDVTQHETLLSPVVGVFNGFITGLTGSSVIPGTIYFQALNMPRDELIQAMGILFSLSAVALGVALVNENLVSVDLGLASIAGLVPAFLGMWLGLRVRRRISHVQFRNALFAGLGVLGIFITIQAVT